MEAKPTIILLRNFFCLELEIRFCPPRSRKIQLLTLDGHGFESHPQKDKKVGGGSSPGGES